MAITQHATLGASSSSRWMACAGSIRMSEGMPNESSVFAREGSAAHEIGEICLRDTEAQHSLLKNKNAIDLLGYVVPEYPEIEINETLCAAVQEYLDAVRWEIEKYELAGFDDWELAIEHRFDLTHIYPGMYGTSDAVLYLPAWNRIIVFDYKHGWVSVAVEHNSQAMYYALGAITGKHNRAIDDIELVIVQPRTGRDIVMKKWSCTPETLYEFKDKLIEAAKRTEASDSALNPGEWCKFCPAAPVCKTLMKKVMELIMATEDPIDGISIPNPDKISFSELKRLWENASMIEGWVKNVKAYAHQQAMAGNLLPGTKLVEGRAYRKWRDENTITKDLESLRAIGEIEGDIFITKLKSPSQIEDMLPKKYHSIIKNLWVKGRGALALVPESDEKESAKVDPLKEFL